MANLGAKICAEPFRLFDPLLIGKHGQNRRHVSVDLRAMKDAVCASEDAMTTVASFGLIVTLPLIYAIVDLPEHDSRAVLAATHLAALGIPLLICTPHAAAISGTCRRSPERKGVHAAIRLIRRDIGWTRTAAPIVMPGHPELACSSFNCFNDVGGDAAVNVAAFFARHDLALRSRLGQSPAAEVLLRRPGATSAPEGPQRSEGRRSRCGWRTGGATSVASRGGLRPVGECGGRNAGRRVLLQPPATLPFQFTLCTTLTL